MGIGRTAFHSREDGSAHLDIRGRCAASASHRMNMKNRVAKKDTVAPREDSMFHFAYASG